MSNPIPPSPYAYDNISGKMAIPDALTPSGRPIELKPNTTTGRRQGQKQIEIYNRVYKRKGRVIYYEPKK